MNAPLILSTVLPPVVAAPSPQPSARSADAARGSDDTPSFGQLMRDVVSRPQADKPAEKAVAKAVDKAKRADESPDTPSASDTPPAPSTPATPATATGQATPPAQDNPPASAATAPSEAPANPATPPGWLVAMAHGAGQQSAAVAASGNPVLTSGVRGGLHTLTASVPSAPLAPPTDATPAQPGATGRPQDRTDAAPLAQATDTQTLPPGALAALAAKAKADTGDAPRVADSDTPTPRLNAVGARAAVLATLDPAPTTAGPLTPAGASATPVPAGAAFAAALGKEQLALRTDKDAQPTVAGALASHTPTVALADGEAGAVYRGTLQAHPASAAFPAELAGEVKLLMKSGLQQAELHLNPTDLGPIRIDLTLSGQTADIQFSAAHAATREGIQQSLAELRDMLGSQGIGLGQTQVGADTSQQQAAAQREAAQQAQTARQTSTPAGGAGPSGAAASAEPARVVRPRGVLDMYA